MSNKLLPVMVLPSADAECLVDGKLHNDLDQSWVTFKQRSRVPCFLQCTLSADNMTINVWQTHTFSPTTTTLDSVLDLHLCTELTLYPVIFQPLDEACTHARVMRVLKAVCKNTSNSFTDTRTLASAVLGSVATSDRPSKTKRKRGCEDDEEDEEEEDEDEEEEEDEEEDDKNDDGADLRDFIVPDNCNESDTGEETNNEEEENEEANTNAEND